MKIKFLNIKFLNKSLLIELGKGKSIKRVFVLGDLHIGYEESLNKKGILVPRHQFKEMVTNLKKIFLEIKKVDEIVILGDLKHEFGEISQQEWRETLEILDFFEMNLKKKGKITLVKGNHDTILEPIARKKKIETKEFYILGKICFLHGNRMFPECIGKEIKMLVLGHRHPAVTLSDKYKKEKYKCFLIGNWKKKEIIILPSFLPFIEGGDIINRGCNRMFISEKELKNFGVRVLGDNGKVYWFGKLRKII